MALKSPGKISAKIRKIQKYRMAIKSSISTGCRKAAKRSICPLFAAAASRETRAHSVYPRMHAILPRYPVKSPCHGFGRRT